MDKNNAFTKHTLIASCIMILSAAALYFLSSGENIHPNKPFQTFPREIGEWTGKERFLSDNIEDVVGVDDYFLCDYRNPEGRQINLYIGFYQSQREGDLIHSPKNCMPGAGWNITRTSLETLDIPDTDFENLSVRKMKAIKLIVKKGPQKQIMLYWFQSRGRIISSEYMQKVWLVIDSVTRRRTDGSFVRLVAPISDNEALTLEHVKDFARELAPILREYIPA